MNGAGIAVDAAGNAYVTGSTQSSNLPTKNAFQSALSSTNLDTFVTKIDPTQAGAASRDRPTATATVPRICFKRLSFRIGGIV